MTDIKYIITNKFGVTKLTRNSDNFYQDDKGTLYAYKDGATSDPVDRFGIWPFALPLWPIFQAINDAAKPHDFQYTAPVYQAFHTEEEANHNLDQRLALIGHPLLGAISDWATNQYGFHWWENLKTADKPTPDPVDSEKTLDED